MPSASSAAPARRRSRSAPRTPSRPRGVAQRGAPVRVRWERIGRIALLVVFAVVVLLYAKQGLSLLSTHSQADQQLALVHKLARENQGLIQQQKSLNDPATITRYARALGMVKPGERPYAITGLPGH